MIEVTRKQLVYLNYIGWGLVGFLLGVNGIDLFLNSDAYVPYTDEERKDMLFYMYINPDPQTVCDNLNSGEIVINDIPVKLQWIKEACDLK